MTTYPADLIDWLDSHNGAFCFIELQAPDGTLIARLRGTLKARSETPGAAFYELDDGRSNLGMGQPGITIPARLKSAATIDDAAIKYTTDTHVVRLVLGAQ